MNTFVKGLVLGVGFAVGIIVIGAIVVAVVFMSPLRFGSPHSIVGTNAISIGDYRLEFQDGKPVVLGTVRNATGKRLTSVIVEALLFDKDGCFIDKQWDYTDCLSPEEVFGFRIHFYNWDRDETEDKLTCKVRIRQGYDRE